jgi:hypothetical protein
MPGEQFGHYGADLNPRTLRVGREGGVTESEVQIYAGRVTGGGLNAIATALREVAASGRAIASAIREHKAVKS